MGWGSADDEQGRTTHMLLVLEEMKEYEWWMSSLLDVGDGGVLSQMEKAEKGGREKQMKQGTPEGQGSTGALNLLMPETSPARPSWPSPPLLAPLAAPPVLASPAPPPVAIPPQPHKQCCGPSFESLQSKDTSLDAKHPAKCVGMPQEDLVEELGLPISLSQSPKPLCSRTRYNDNSIMGAWEKWWKVEGK